MDMILFVIGLVLWWRGRFSFGSINTQGRHVKAAGVVLMLPAVSIFLFGMLSMMVLGTQQGMALAFSGVSLILGLSLMILASVIAYILIADPPQAPRLPGILGEIQDERRGLTPPTSPTRSTPPAAPARPVQRHPLERSATPAAPNQRPVTARSIMTVREAADYMGVPQGEIMAWIEAGKLPAARGNGGFVIARSLLDEMKQGNNQPETMQPA